LLLNIVIGNIGNRIINLKISYITYQYERISITVQKRLPKGHHVHGPPNVYRRKHLEIISDLEREQNPSYDGA